MYEIVFTKLSLKDVEKLKQSGLDKKAKSLLDVIKTNPYQNPPPYEKLSGNLSGAYSRRINRKHRLVYMIFENEKKIKILRMWTHYE